MEIGHYLQVVRRRWWLVALTTLAALLVAGLLAYRGATAYRATVRVAVSVPVPPDCAEQRREYDCNYYAWLASEYLADDMSELVRSRSFAQDVSRILGEGEDFDPRSISEVTRTRKTHRILSIIVSANTFDRAQRMGDAIVQAIRQDAGKYLAQLATTSGQLVVIDPPQTQRGEGAGPVALEITLRTLLGLLFGLALVFALDYFDPTVRDARDIERTLGLPLLGEIPGASARQRQAAARG